MGEIAGNKTFRPKALEVAGKEAFYARKIAGKEAFRCQAWEIACKEAFGGGRGRESMIRMHSELEIADKEELRVEYCK